MSSKNGREQYLKILLKGVTIGLEPDALCEITSSNYRGLRVKTDRLINVVKGSPVWQVKVYDADSGKFWSWRSFSEANLRRLVLDEIVMAVEE